MPLITSHIHGQFCWAELVARDMPVAVEFYTKILGWTLTDLNENADDCVPHVQFEHDGQPVAGLIKLPDDLLTSGLPGVWNTYVCVDDLNDTLKKVIQFGGEITCPVTDAGEHGLVAFIKDPTGGVTGLWQRGSHGGASLHGDVNTVCWNELASRDAYAAKEFYGKLFDWTFEDNPMSESPYFIVKLSNGEQIAGIMQMTEEWGEMPSHWTLYFNVDAVDVVAAHVQQLNGRMLVAPFDTPVGRLAVLADNQGAVFSVIRLAEAVSSA
jgi:predicted enzyme related to lactoylglutathione lyase